MISVEMPFKAGEWGHMLKWLDDNIKKGSYSVTFKSVMNKDAVDAYHFENEEDAMAFKLRWL